MYKDRIFCDKIEKQAPFPVLKYTCRLMQRNGGVSTILYICHECRIVDGLYAGPVHGRKAACVADAPSRPMPLHRHRANRKHSTFRKRRIRSGAVIGERRARRCRACCRASSGTATTWRRWRAGCRPARHGCFYPLKKLNNSILEYSNLLNKIHFSYQYIPCLLKYSFLSKK